MSYLILEVHKSYCIALDTEGRFLRAANLGYEIGQTTGHIVPMDEAGPKPIPRRMVTAAAALAACLALLFAALFSPPPAAYGAVYLRINPAVRAGVSESGAVLSLTPLNEDASALLEGYRSRKKPLNTVARELVDRAIDLGFLSEGGAVTIDIDAPDEVWFQQTGMALRQDLDQYLAARFSVTIEIRQHDKTPPAELQPPAVPEPQPAPAPQPAPPVYSDDSGYTDYEGSPFEDGSDYSDFQEGSPYEADSPYEDDSGHSNYDD